MSKAKRLGNAGEDRVVVKAQSKGLPARKQPGSGVFKDFPSDVVIDNRILTEVKVRAVKTEPIGQRYFPLDLNWLDKVVGEAAGCGFDMGIVVVQPKGSAKQYAMIQFDTLLELLCSLRSFQASSHPKLTSSE